MPATELLHNLPPQLHTPFSLHVQNPVGSAVYYFAADTTRQLHGFVHFSHSEENCITCVTPSGATSSPTIAFSRIARYLLPQLGETFVHILWLRPSSVPFSIYCNGTILDILHGNCLQSSAISTNPLVPLPLDPAKKKWQSTLLAWWAKAPWLQNRYKRAWLFVDRDFKADDNAEHLYRWVKKHIPQQNIFFAINKNSPDWSRLEQGGFKLIDLQSMEYFFAYRHCAWLISSNTTGYITKPGWRKRYAGDINHQFCFLQHGVTKDYLPDIARRQIDLLVTSAQQEYSSLATSPEYAYPLSRKEVVLTGMPRFDSLLRKAAQGAPQKHMLIMPTWRQYVVGAQKKASGQMEYSKHFLQSPFFTTWAALLSSRELWGQLKTHGYTVSLYPHPYLRQHLADFQEHALPEINFIDDTTTSLQDALTQSSLLLTDYSSVAFDFALLKRPIIYFQFDAEQFFANHSYKKGYFEYTQQGFGPVAHSQHDVHTALLAYAENGCAMETVYRERVANFFGYIDQNNCQRVYEALLACSQPYTGQAHTWSP